MGEKTEIEKPEGKAAKRAAPERRSYSSFSSLKRTVKGDYEEVTEKRSGTGVIREKHTYDITVGKEPVDGKYNVKMSVDGATKETQMTNGELAEYGLYPGKQVLKKVYGVASAEAVTEKEKFEEDMRKFRQEMDGIARGMEMWKRSMLDWTKTMMYWPGFMPSFDTRRSMSDWRRYMPELPGKAEKKSLEELKERLFKE